MFASRSDGSHKSGSLSRYISLHLLEALVLSVAAKRRQEQEEKRKSIAASLLYVSTV
jgi:hypothetical protein